MVGKDLEAERISLTKDGHLSRPTVLQLTRPTNELQNGMMKLPKEIRNLLAGGIAGMVAKSFVAPFERIKILYQISSARFQISKIPAVAMNIVKEEGITALWKGNSATMIRVFPYSGIQFMVYDRCKTKLLREQEVDYARRKALDPNALKPKWGLTPKESLVSGMMAGVISVFCTYPLDMTRAQLAVLRRHKDSSCNMSFYRVLTDNYRSRVRIFKRWKMAKVTKAQQLHFLFYRDWWASFVASCPRRWGFFLIRVLLFR
jgi:Mitochondrial carrier protein